MLMERQPKPAPPTKKNRRASEPSFAAGTIETPSLGPERSLSEDEVTQIVHDLRDPIAMIALEAYVLDRKLAKGDYSEVRSTTARIIRNVEFLDRMVQTLLDSCALGEGRLEINRRPTELRALLEQVIDRVVSTRDCGRVTLDAPFPITLPIDELRIGSVVANLIGNALKYTPAHAGIVVKLEAGALAAQISVSDAGPGLTRSERVHIFDKYYRGTNADSRDGRGLGLYVSKAIVEAHGGRISVDSVEGAGSKFYFDLPAIYP
jgi:signal transduction histidine kinase